MQQQSTGKIRYFILGLLILATAGGLSWYLKHNPPKAQRETPPAPVLQVEILIASAQDYTVQIESYGTVQPRTQGTLTAQVNGEIIMVSEAFRQGSFFEKGDLMIEIDPRDYQSALVNAKANVSQSLANLAQEQAQADQAARDWKRLGNTGAATDLVLRKPQLAAASAQLESSKAALAKAELDLNRTRITAPYAGRIISKNVDLGQFVNAGSQLAEIFAIDYVEVRLPLTSREYDLLEITESYRGENIIPTAKNSPTVSIESSIGNSTYSFNGFISRSEGVFDASTRQTYVVAHIDDPYGKRSEGTPPLKIGQFVTARIHGRLLSGIFVVPNSAIYQGSYVYTVEDNVLRRRDIKIIWQDDENSVISEGLGENDRVVTTPLNDTVSGTQVQLETP